MVVVAAVAEVAAEVATVVVAVPAACIWTRACLLFGMLPLHICLRLHGATLSRSRNADASRSSIGRFRVRACPNKQLRTNSAPHVCCHQTRHTQEQMNVHLPAGWGAPSATLAGWSAKTEAQTHPASCCGDGTKAKSLGTASRQKHVARVASHNRGETKTNDLGMCFGALAPGRLWLRHVASRLLCGKLPLHICLRRSG